MLRPPHLLLFGLSAFALPGNSIAQSPHGRTWPLEEVARIAPEAPAYVLSDVPIARIAVDGTVFMYDRQEVAVLQFAADGQFLRRIGRKGGGPGEFLGIQRLGFVGDSLWIQDARQRRVTWFVSGDAANVETVGEESLLEMPSAVLRDGTFTTTAPSTNVDQVVVNWKARTGELLAVLGSFETAPATRTILDGTSRLHLRDPFSHHMLAAPAADGSAVAYISRPRSMGRRGQYEVVTLRDGEIYKRAVDYATRRLSEAENQGALDDLMDLFRRYTELGFPMTEARFAELIRERVPVPEYALPVMDAIMDLEGNLWLLESKETMATWVAYETDGEEVGRVVLPIGESLVDVGYRQFLTQKFTVLDEPFFVLYKASPQ